MCNLIDKNTIISCLCTYTSTRYIKVKNKKLAITYHLIIIGVLLYVLIYTVMLSKGYQENDFVIGTSSSKVKGTASVGSGDWENITVYDAMDIVNPATEEDALFITTSHVITNNQVRGVCDGNIDTGACTIATTRGKNCTRNKYSEASQGVLTGICGSNGFCQVSSWCPLEKDIYPTPLENIGNFTIFVKVDVVYTNFNIKRTNTYDVTSNGSPKRGYNLFTVDEILHKADNNIISYKDINSKGVIILATSIWDCNFDKKRKNCNPKWNFQRLDGKYNSISNGYNFRDVQYSIDGNQRRLRKLYGIRIIWEVAGEGRRFSFVALTITIGAGLGFLGIASLFTDFVLKHFIPDNQRYVEEKFKEVHRKCSELQDIRSISIYQSINQN